MIFGLIKLMVAVVIILLLSALAFILFFHFSYPEILNPVLIHIFPGDVL